MFVVKWRLALFYKLGYCSPACIKDARMFLYNAEEIC